MNAPTCGHVTSENYFDVSSWNGSDPHKDIGQTINEILTFAKSQQHAVTQKPTVSQQTQPHEKFESSPRTQSTLNNEVLGKPGITIHIPAGDWPLHTQILIDMSFVRIEGEGHGFISSSIRYNEPQESWSSMQEIWPGGSRIINLLESEHSAQKQTQFPPQASDHPADTLTQAGVDGAAILIRREATPRISSVELVGINIDGAHFLPTEQAGQHNGAAYGLIAPQNSTNTTPTDLNPENSYCNAKCGVWVDSANDSFVIENCGFVYLERAVVIRKADALSLHHNFIAECGNCVEILDWAQASKLTDNLIGAGYRGHSILVENGGGLLISANNVFPRGVDSVSLINCTRTSISANRFNSFYPGMLLIKGTENLVATNHLYRSAEPWTPMLSHRTSVEDTYGLIRVEGDDNSIMSNHISIVLDAENLVPRSAHPVAINIAIGRGNKIATNHIVAKTENASTSSQAKASAFQAQVGAVLATSHVTRIPVVCVKANTPGNIVLDSGPASELNICAGNAVRPDPEM